jgi:chemotaxis signal transduction protein
VARIDAEIAAGEGAQYRAATRDGAASPRRYVLFSLAGVRCAAAIESVLETGYVPALTRVPNVPRWVAGVANLRGDVLAVLDLRSLLGFEAPVLRPAGRLLIVRSLDGMAGLLVDALHGALSTSAEVSRRAPHAPGLAGERLAHFTLGWLEQGDDVVAVLDLEAMLQDAEIQRLRRG